MDSVNIVLKTKSFVITETGGRIHTASIGGFSGVIQDLGKLVYKLMTDSDTQPMATLEHTYEPDLRHYHYYAEHKIENISFDGYLSCTWDGNGEGAGGGLVEAVKQSTCELAWQKKMIKSNPNDWVIKSLSRL